MGLPMVQVFMIVARQMSKPVADLVMRYGKNHPLFRNKILVPIGIRLVNLTTRLRMKNLGLGAPTSVASVSESAALEQASEFVQQVVIFSYTVGVFYAYQQYSKSHDILAVSKSDFNKTCEELENKINKLSDQIQEMNDKIEERREKSSWFFWLFSSSSKEKDRRHSEPATSTISHKEAMQRITSLPNDLLND